jgi:F-type H+-transporting ATPase subunit delta
MPTALASRYARALADVVLKTGAKAEAVLAELDGFRQALAVSPDLKRALESPAVPPARKHAVIAQLEKMLAGAGLVRRFLMVLIDHRRMGLLEEIREAFETEMDERLGIASAEVTSARPLNERQRAEVLRGLSRLTGRQTRARFAVREELIGGTVAQIGSTVYDGSVRGQLEGLRQRLAGRET